MKRLDHPLLLAVSAALVLASAALAQPEASRLEMLQLQIWPEYDRPEALVMLTGTLPPGTSLPVTVALPMPVKSPQPSAVAQREVGGGLMIADWDFAIEGEFAMVSITAEMPEVRLEYYVPMDLSAPERRFRFEWPGGIEVGRIAYEVMQPAGARDLFVFPASSPPQVTPNGLTVQVGDLGSLATGDRFVLELGYVKTSPQLTAPAQGAPQMQAPPAAASPQAGPAPAGVTPGSQAAGQERPGVHVAWMWLAIVALIVAVAALVVAIRK